MPYITERSRSRYDPLIDKLFVELTPDYNSGDITYIIYKLFLKVFESKPKFKTINELRGILIGVLHELNRRKFDAYEDSKILENGDV